MAAVERQEDLDVVLTVPLKEGTGCQAQASHQGAPLSPPHQTQTGLPLEASAPQHSNPGVMENLGALWGRRRSTECVYAGGGPWSSASSVSGKLCFGLQSGAQIASFFFFFFFSFFGHTTAYGVPRLGIRSKLQLQWQHQIHNPLCQDQGSNLHPRAPKTPPILLHHRGSSHNPFLLMSCLVPTW